MGHHDGQIDVKGAIGRTPDLLDFNDISHRGKDYSPKIILGNYIVYILCTHALNSSLECLG